VIFLDRTTTPGMSRRFLWPIVELRRGRGWVMLYVWAGRTIRTLTLRDETADQDEAFNATFLHARRSSTATPTLTVRPGAGPSLPPERWSYFQEGGTLLVHRPQLKKGDQLVISKLTMIDVPEGCFVVVLTPEEVHGATSPNETER
jgi:hypothetical protein